MKSNPAVPVATLYPRPKECPSCLYNLHRWKLVRAIDAGEWLPKCPNCKTDLLGH